MNKTAIALLAGAGMLASATASARDLRVEVTNLTNGSYFTPLLVAAHRRGTHLFRLGDAASDNLQAMAEGGDLTGLIGDVEAAGGTYVANPAAGVLGPGERTTAELDVHGRANARMSVVAMILPTNDAFVGLDSIRIPHRRGVYTYLLRGYDAGTEAKDEIINGGGAPGTPGIPADPGGNGGMHGTGAAGPDLNPNVHVHRGVLGDDDPNGGPSDLDRAIHRWNNPVARVVIKVGGRHHDDD